MQHANLIASDSFYTCLLSQITEDAHPVGRTCLITGDALQEPVVNLSCGHAFNYKPLLEEVRNQKDCKNEKLHLEVQKLRLYQMKCPYCRTVHDTLLPSLEDEEKIFGVNWPQRYTMFLHKCSYELSSGKRKGLPCQRQCNELMCPRHTKIMQSFHECSYKLKTGKRKGMPCKRRGRDSGLCYLHENKNKEP